MQKIWTKDLNKYFTKEDIKMNKKHMNKRYSTTLVIGEMPIRFLHHSLSCFFQSL